MFSWDDKFAGAHIVVAKNVLEGKYPEYPSFGQYKNYGEQFICNCIQKGSSNVQKTTGGLLWWQPWNNLQYTTSALFIITTYADKLISTKNPLLHCPTGSVRPEDMIAFVRSQVDNILGWNSKNMSYMVGFGSKYPQRVHHRGSSIISIQKDNTPVGCKEGFSNWFNKDAPNPNVLEGAIVGGPDLNDGYSDSRGNFQQAEPATANTAPLVGVLARLAS